jgi:Protein of unknown function (DUF3618)
MGQESNKATIERGSVEQSTANTSGPSVTTEEIRSQIEQTRARMSETIDAIQDRLSPSRLMTDAKEKVKDATIGRVKDLINRSGEYGNGGRTSFGAERAIQVVKSNPVPMALIGAAVAALTAGAWMRSRNGTSRTANRDTYAGHTTRRGFGRNKRTLLLGACSGIACWRAWRAHQSKAELRPPAALSGTRDSGVSRHLDRSTGTGHLPT